MRSHHVFTQDSDMIQFMLSKSMTLGKSCYVSALLFFSSVKGECKSGQVLKDPLKIKRENVLNEINLFKNG